MFKKIIIILLKLYHKQGWVKGINGVNVFTLKLVKGWHQTPLKERNQGQKSIKLKTEDQEIKSMKQRVGCLKK